MIDGNDQGVRRLVVRQQADGQAAGIVVEEDSPVGGKRASVSQLRGPLVKRCPYPRGRGKVIGGTKRGLLALAGKVVREPDDGSRAVGAAVEVGPHPTVVLAAIVCDEVGEVPVAPLAMQRG